MQRILCSALLLVITGSPALAQEGSVRVSLGYAFAKYLEEDGGSAPFGVYLSLASKGKIGFEFDMAYHNDSEEVGSTDYTLHTITVMGGPRFTLSGSEARPFVHLLGGFRHDSIEGFSDTSGGFAVGGGVDAGFLHMGGDFQMFFNEGENLKVLRVSIGVVF